MPSRGSAAGASAGIALLIACSTGEPAPVPRSPESASDIHVRAAAHVSAGDAEAAAALLRRGIADHPDAAELHARLGYVYRYAGLMDESIRAYRRAQELDSTPRGRMSAEEQIAKSHIYLGEYQRAIDSHQTIDSMLRELGQSPDEKIPFYDGVAHFYAGRGEEAARLFDTSRDINATSIWTAFAQSYKQAALGNHERLLRMTNVLETEYQDEVADGERRYRLAHFFALGGEPADALRNLEASIEAGFFNYPYIQRDPWLESIRSTDEFRVLLERARARHVAFKENHG